jgi:serine protease AprX
VPAQPPRDQDPGHQDAADDAAAQRQRLLRPSTISETLQDERQRQRAGLLAEDDRFAVLVELNLLHARALPGAREEFLELFERTLPGARDRPPLEVATNYYRCVLTQDEIERLVHADQDGRGAGERAIYRVWPDFRVEQFIDRSVATVKGDAALRSYQASGLGVTWAVADSGINALHPHFAEHASLQGDVAELHKDFTELIPLTGKPLSTSALVDGQGHGSAVAGIVAGALGDRHAGGALVGQHVVDERNQERIVARRIEETCSLTGVAPMCKLVSLKVVDDDGASSVAAILAALHYVRTVVNADGKLPRIHGVNLSLGYKFEARWFACGQSPLCDEVNQLVRSGVVVVVAAGNNGYGQVDLPDWGPTRVGLTLTITDPGNAAGAITVGATHRDSPHTYGVSYFSSKGPTGDGRLKPDLVAPGERITSCAAGRMLRRLAPIAGGAVPGDDAPCYIDDTGTSMAAPHVSGAIAGFLSVRREFIGRPDEVKQLFCQHATSLGRERYFEGHGLVDLMRTIQAV